MIIAKIIGGLGNQMFQLAFAEVMRQIHQTNLYLDISDYVYYPDRQYDMDCFETNFTFVKPAQLRRFREAAGRRQKIEKWISQMRNGQGQILKEKEEHQFRFNAKILKKYTKDLYVIGYWQSYRYFIDYQEDIRKIFTFRQPLNARNQAVLHQIGDEFQTVALHVRRGDYVQDKTVNQVHGVCSMAYYQKAIEVIHQKIANPYFIIFSDDITWCKSAIKTGFSQLFIDYPNKNWEDMQLMSLCKHQIIANSSFSWWGAWLNQNPEKVVVAPQKWLAEKPISMDDVLPKNWIKL